MIAFDKAASKLTILLSLLKPLRVVADIYSKDGRFIKRLFDMRMERGLTEIISLGYRMGKEAFVVLLNSGDGIMSFKIKNRF